MTRDEQEAKSWRFGNRGLLLVPLSSKKWAIFDRWGYECHGYVELPEDVQIVMEKISVKSQEMHQPSEVDKSPLTSAKTVDELGL